MASVFEATAGLAIGYTSGSSVTQDTDKSTGVTINAAAGAITMNAAALAAGVEVSFTVTNDKVTASDVVVVNHASAGTAGAYMVQANSLASGSFAITVSNVSGSSASEAIVLNFVVIKGATS